MTISYYESGERKPGMDTIKALAKVLGVKVIDFMKRVEEYEAEEEAREEQHYKDLEKYVKSLSKSELQDKLYDALCELEYSKRVKW